ncbi:MAG: glucans biosynthesis glucosyltransferase MdoH [Alphaproteobacteria bacterium]
MKPGSIAGFAAETLLDAGLSPSRPPDAPLAMPRQPLHGLRRNWRPGGSVWRKLTTAAARLLLVAGTLGLSGYGVIEMHGVMATGGLTVLQWVFLVFFALNFTWISLAFCQAVLGFLRQLGSDLAFARPPGEDPVAFRTAILAPVYNEDGGSVAARLSAMTEGLGRLAPGRYAVFILSDSNRPAAWIAEEAAFARLIAGASDDCPIYYRHRRDNTERKAGNIADWVSRWGGAYDAMLVLDADSLIGPETIVEMTRRLAADPGLGLLQTLPAIVRARSLYARLQQFANRCYGPVVGHGLAAWHGRSGNFWGHNAIIRTEAFAAACRLPILGGKPPFGGPVLSHDFIEAALLVRAGWGVRLDADLPDSFEEAPPSLQDVMVRDRRWCQGNLQHGRFVFARGLRFVSRMHLLSGMMAYLSAPLWFGLVAVGLVIAVQAALAQPEYFTEPSLFPTWPVFDSERAIGLFVLSIAVVLGPKTLGWLGVMLHPRRLFRFGGPLALTAGVVAELLMSVLYAPIMMMAQSRIVREVLLGGDSGWAPQRRGDGSIPFADAVRAHRWHMGAGAGLGLLAWTLNPDLFLWMLPITAGLVLAAPLSWIGGSVGWGNALRRLAILRTPEERRLPGILAAYEENLERFAVEPDGPLRHLVRDRSLRDWHLAQIEDRTESAPEQIDVPGVLARTKSERAADLAALEKWLTPEETMAFLQDREPFLAWCAVEDERR